MAITIAKPVSLDFRDLCLDRRPPGDAKITIAAGAEMPAAEAASVQEPTVKDLFTTQQTCAARAPSPRRPFAAPARPRALQAAASLDV